MANVLADQGKYPEALENYRQSLQISREIDDREGIAEAYLNMGILYEEMGVYDSSQRDLEISLAMHRELGDRMGESTTCQSLGSLFVKTGKAALAREWLIKGLELAQRSGARDEMKYCYRDLAAADSALSDLKGAFFNYQKYILYRDSLVNEDNTRRSVRQQMQFEFDLRESEGRIEQQKKDALALAASQRQRVIIAAVSTGLAIIFLLSIVTLRSLRVNQRKNRIIEVQKHAVERQKDIIEQKQKEMLDSIRYAKRIQQALITNEHYIHKNMSRLKKV
jgi:tetratricopeptide (TPR) repeat protein